MTTTKTPARPDPSANGALRILPISADLLPSEILDNRRGRKVRRIVLIALAGLVVAIAAWYGEARYQSWVAGTAVVTAEENALQAQRQQRDFAELVATRAESQAINTQLGGLLATDLRWSELLSSLRAAAPPGVEVTSAVGTLVEAGAEPADGATTEAVGKLTVTGTGTTKAGVAAYVDALAGVTGLGNPLLNSVTDQEGELQFTAQFEITTSALGGRYEKSTTGPGED